MDFIGLLGGMSFIVVFSIEVAMSHKEVNDISSFQLSQFKK